MQQRRIFPRCGAIALVLASASLATPLPPGGNATLTGSDLSTHPEWAGFLENDALIPWEIRNASDTVILTGTIQNRVSVANTTGNLVISPSTTPAARSVPRTPAGSWRSA